MARPARLSRSRQGDRARAASRRSASTRADRSSAAAAMARRSSCSPTRPRCAPSRPTSPRCATIDRLVIVTAPGDDHRRRQPRVRRLPRHRRGSGDRHRRMPRWCRSGPSGSGATRFSALQASKRTGGSIATMAPRDGAGATGCVLGGHAVTVIEGQFRSSESIPRPNCPCGNRRRAHLLCTAALPAPGDAARAALGHLKRTTHAPPWLHRRPPPQDAPRLDRGAGEDRRDDAGSGRLTEMKGFGTNPGRPGRARPIVPQTLAAGRAAGRRAPRLHPERRRLRPRQRLVASLPTATASPCCSPSRRATNNHNLCFNWYQAGDAPPRAAARPPRSRRWSAIWSRRTASTRRACSSTGCRRAGR